MRALILKDEDGDSLLDALELSKLRKGEFKNIHDEEKRIANDMHRSFHCVVARWLNEHGFKTTK